MPTLMTDTLWGLPPEYMEQLLVAHKHSGEGAWSDEPTGELQAVYSVVRGVAVILVTGTLYRFSQDAIRQATEAALADSSVRAILYAIDSPGGVVAGTKELADFIVAARTKKRCAAYANGLCASAAYWLASAFGTVGSRIRNLRREIRGLESVSRVAANAAAPQWCWCRAL